METFSALLVICAGNSPVHGEFPAQRPVTRSFDVIFDVRPNKHLSKQSWGWWFETLSPSLWRHRNDGANKVSTWVLSALGRPHIGPMNLAIWDFLKQNDIKASALSGPVIWENIDGLPRIRIDKIGITVMEYNSENI